MRSKILTVLSTAALAMGTYSLGAMADEEVQALVVDNGTNTRVMICHKGREIMVGLKAAVKHVAHGDTLGACPP